MRLQIKTYSQKTIFIDIEETKTVYDLKTQLHKLPDIASPPDKQQLIYAGQILKNDVPLTLYKLDEKKPLVIMIEKLKDAKKTTTHREEATSTSDDSSIFKKPAKKTTSSSSTVAAATSSSPAAAATTSSSPVKHEKLVKNIVNLGYTEADVRRALLASFDNAERAIEYLADGEPKSPTTPESTTDANTTTESEVSPFEFLRTDPVFKRLKRSIMRNPILLNTAIKRVGEINPHVLQYVKEHHEEFLSMLCESSEDEEEEEVE